MQEKLAISAVCVVLLLMGVASVGGQEEAECILLALDLGPWTEVQKMVGGDEIVKGLESAAELAKANPRDERMREALIAMQDVVFLEDEKARKAARAAAGKVLHVLREAFEKAPDVDTAMNFVAVAAGFSRNHLVDKATEKKLRADIYNIKVWDKCTPELYLELAKFYRDEKYYGWALKMLSRALSLADKGEEGRFLRGRIAYQQAEVIFARDGKHSLLAVPFLQRIVQLDREFESSSNRALCGLGAIALAHGDLGQAKTYLALAGRANCGPILLFGYETGLAMELIEAGHPAPAIEYLKIAYENEREPTHKTVFGLGLGYYRKGDKAEARKWFEKYLTLEYKPKESFVRSILHSLKDEEKPSVKE